MVASISATQQPAFRGGGGGSWSPAMLGADLQLWYDAEDSSTLDLAGSVVTNWREKRGVAITLTQATTSFKPLYAAAGLNGRPCLTFDGTDDSMASNAAAIAATIGTGTATGQMWVLASDTQGVGVGAQGRTVLSTSGSAVTRRAIVRRNSTTHAAGIVTGTGASAFSDYAATAKTDGIHVYQALFEANRQRLFMDGVGTPVVDVAQAMNSNNNIITAGTAATSYWLGGVNSVLFTNQLSAENESLLTEYLKKRGGII